LRLNFTDHLQSRENGQDHTIQLFENN